MGGSKDDEVAEADSDKAIEPINLPNFANSGVANSGAPSQWKSEQSSMILTFWS
jgi:hypothetical protein